MELQLSSQSLGCPNCGDPLNLYNPEKSKIVKCPGCSQLLALQENGSATEIEKLKTPPKYKLPEIKIGDWINYKGEDLKVIGHAVFQEEGTNYRWSEFYLKGFTEVYSLSEFKGGYCMFKEAFLLPDEVKDWKNSLEVNDRSYDLFNKYTIVLRDVKGEIPFDPEKTTAAIEYVAPPYMMICQKISGKAGTSYFQGEYVSTRQLEKLFGRSFPDPEVTPATKVLNRKFTPRQAFLAYLVFLFLIICYQLYYGSIHPDKKLVSTSSITANTGFIRPTTEVQPEPVLVDPASVEIGDTSGMGPEAYQKLLVQLGLAKDTAKPKELTSDLFARPGEVITPSFHVSDEFSVLNIKLFSPVENEWISIDGILVNEKTNEERYFASDIEYYTGYEDGAAWAEGSKTSDLYITHVPQGDYHLVFSAMMTANHETTYFDTEVIENPGSKSNLVWMAIFLSIFPIVFFFMERDVNKKRWSNSDYNPYSDYE